MNNHWKLRKVLRMLCSQTLFLLFLLLVSCKKTETGNDWRSAYGTPTTLNLESNSQYMVAGNGGVLRLFACVYNAEGKLYPYDASKLQFFCNGNLMPADTFSTDQPGNYTFQAAYENVFSEEMIVQVRPDKSYPLISLPVIFHIIDQPQITKETIHQLIADANKIFRKTPGSIGDNDHPSGIDTGIELRLAQYDTLGQTLTEPGMVRHSMSEEEYHKGVLSYLFSWNPSEYINVFISDLQSTGGGTTTFAQDTFPGIFPLQYGLNKYSSTENLDYRKWTHGVNVNAKNLHDLSYLLVHELGHDFGLKHTFDDVFIENDFCPDTFFYIYPLEKNRRFCGCQPCVTFPVRKHTNVMDYVDRIYNLTFTFDQRERMRWVLDYSPWLKDLKHSAR